MEWLEVSVAVENEVAEAVAEVLSRYAYRGVAIEAGPEGWGATPVVVRAYMPVDDELPSRQRRVREALWHLAHIRPIPEPTFQLIAEADWAEAWKERMPVLHVGQRTVICPSWREHLAEGGEFIIRLDPGQAFGTGLHPTTQMCLVALETLVWSGAEVLDLGTGSGILAIAAAKLGAKRVLALDNDAVAVRAAVANVTENGVESLVSVELGSLPEVSGCYDVLVVNILAAVILEMLQMGLAARVRPGGTLVLAGLLDDQEAAVAAALGREGLTLVERRQTDDWVCLVATPGVAGTIACGDRQSDRV